MKYLFIYILTLPVTLGLLLLLASSLGYQTIYLAALITAFGITHFIQLLDIRQKQEDHAKEQ